jgi:hypothetical protein
MTRNLFCISDEELAEDRAADSGVGPGGIAWKLEAPTVADRALVATIKRTDTRRMPYTGPWPRKRHYHRCPKCREHGGGGVNCYKSRCTLPVLLSGPCSWCRF